MWAHTLGIGDFAPQYCQQKASKSAAHTVYVFPTNHRPRGLGAKKSLGTDVFCHFIRQIRPRGALENAPAATLRLLQVGPPLLDHAYGTPVTLKRQLE